MLGLQDFRLFMLDCRQLHAGGNIAGKDLVIDGALKTAAQHPVSVGDRLGMQAALEQGRMPSLELRPLELLQHDAPQVWNDLVLSELPVPFYGPG